MTICWPELILHKCDSENVPLVRKIFSWVTLTPKPLTLKDLAIALAINPNSTSLRLLDPPRNIATDLLSICGGFLEIVSSHGEENDKNESKTVRLIHQSAKEYFLNSHCGLNGSLGVFRIRPVIDHIEIAQSCLTYLLFEDFKMGPIKENSLDAGGSEDASVKLIRVLEQKIANTPFLKYAVLNWPFHVRQATPVTEGDNVVALTCKFCPTPQIISIAGISSRTFCLSPRQIIQSLSQPFTWRRGSDFLRFWNISSVLE